MPDLPPNMAYMGQCNCTPTIQEIRDGSEDFGRDFVDRRELVFQGPNEAENLESVSLKNLG